MLVSFIFESVRPASERELSWVIITPTMGDDAPVGLAPVFQSSRVTLHHSSMNNSGSVSTRLFILAAFAVVASPAVATAWQAADGGSAPRVPGFDIPPAPRDPEFPLLWGAVTPLEANPHSPSPAVDAPAPLTAEHPVSLPAVDSWDRSAERVSASMRGGSQPAAADDAAAWKVAVALVAVLSSALAIVAVAGLRRREADGPVSVVRLAPPSRKGS
jgi:hypothetical protein